MDDSNHLTKPRPSAVLTFGKLFLIAFAILLAIPSILRNVKHLSETARSPQQRNSVHAEHRLAQGEEQVSQSEAEHFAEQLSAAAEDTEELETKLAMLFDDQALIKRALEGIDLPTSVSNELKSHVAAAGPFHQLVNAVAAAKSSGGEFRFLRLAKTEEGHCPVFRLLTNNSTSVSYCQLSLGKKAGVVRAVDVELASDGQTLSQTMSQGFRRMSRLVDKKQSVYVGDSDVQAIERLTAIQKLIVAKRYEDALSEFTHFPAAWRQDRVLLVTKCQVAQKVSDSAFQQAFNELEAAFPGDRGCLSIKLELCRQLGDDVELITCVKAMMDEFQDPFPGCFMVPSLISLNRIDEAEFAIQKAKEAAEHRIEPWLCELTLSMHLRDHDRTDQIVVDLERRFPGADLNLSSCQGFDEFSSSEVGAACLARRVGF